MPLLDHFRPPLKSIRQWGSIHSAWANAITQQLNQDLLPPDYFAEPHVQLGNQFEVDVATFRQDCVSESGVAGVATAVWSPPRPALTGVIDSASWDLFEVQVFQDLGGPQLRAAIELVSPADKDRPSHRQAFAMKCGSYLQRGVSVVVIDAVTERSANLHAELLKFLELGPELAWRSSSDLYAVAYRTVLAAGQHRLEVWPEQLAVGERLPTVPLWLDVDLCLPLRLEESYVATCASLRIAP
jgi:hypothetical protein